MKLRERLLARYAIKGVGRVGFATLTCSPAILGSDLQGQFEQVKEKRLVARFVRLYSKLAGRRIDYFSVMEFHKKSGQVHFHLALDGCGRLAPEALRRLQAWCQEHMGTFDYKYMPSARAVRYCLKYLAKGSQESLPAWCGDYRGPIRPFTAAQGFWHDGKARTPSRKTGKRLGQRTLRERFERCEDAGVVGIEEHVSKEDGEVRRRYAFRWPWSIEAVAKAALELVLPEERERVERAEFGFAIALDQVGELARRVLFGDDPCRRVAAAGAAP